MEKAITPQAGAEQTPLISSRFITMMVVLVLVLVLLSGVITVAGNRFGQRLALAGHSDSTEIHTIVIGQDRLQLPANTLRFESQRHDGTSERADLHVLWPEMTGYSAQDRRRFDDVTQSGSLLFLQISQSTMSRDMSGRLEPIYSHLFAGAPESGPYGLTLHRLRPESGYQNEVLYTAVRPGLPDYAIRCTLPSPDMGSSSGDCQRDIHVGRDLSVLYRFSRDLLPQWLEIDKTVAAYVNDRVATEDREEPHSNKKRPPGTTKSSS
ncbi:MAG: hypothetical protein ACOH2J_07875 [Allorhizobium sp.]